METKLRINHELYAKVRKAKHEEKTQIFEDSVDRMGVKINWEHFGKVLEAKKRMELGDEYILESNSVEIKKEKQKFSIGKFLSEAAYSFSLLLSGGTFN